jgi:hypothetical protein
MISRPTVLILGAGASADYGFPTGAQLLRQICANTEPGNNLFDFLFSDMLLPEPEIRKFSTALNKSQAPSADAFLEYRTEFEKIGKAAIAATLIPYESNDRFVSSESNRDGWYSYLFKLMIQDGRFESNTLSVITFNYDRSLEAFFLLALCNLYGINEQEAEVSLSYIPIVHLHGSLGDKLWKSPLESTRAYQPDLTPAWVTDAAEHIKIVHEINLGKEFETATRLLYKAEEILFLGFGFLPVNIERLGVKNVVKWREQDNHSGGNWLAARIGMGTGDVERALRHLGIPVQFGEARNRNITEYLKNTVCLI